jgi:CHAT domain-containing protein
LVVLAALCLATPAWPQQPAQTPDQLAIAGKLPDDIDPAKIAPDLRAPTDEERGKLEAARKFIDTQVIGNAESRKDIPAYRAALAISEQTYGPGHPYTALMLSGLADALFDAGQEQQAEPLHRRGLAIYEQRLGPAHARSRGRAYWLVDHLVKQHRYAEAEPMQRRGIENTQKALGPEAFEVAVDLGALADILRNTGRAGEAVPLLERASAITTRNVGADHMMAIEAVSQWAAALEEAGRYVESEALLRRELAEREASLGADDLQVARIAYSLGRFLRRQRHEADAEALFQRALRIREKVLGPNAGLSTQTLSSIGALQMDQGRYAEAESTYRRMLAGDEARLGKVHPEIATDLGPLADAIESQGREAEAEPLRRRALGVSESTAGADSAATAQALGQLAANLRAQSKQVEAEALARRMLATTEKLFGDAQSDTGLAHNALAMTLEAATKPGQAEAEYRRAIEILDSALGANADDTLNVEANLADLLATRDRRQEAEALYRRVLAGREATLGGEHPETGLALSQLGGVLADQGRNAEAEPLYRRALAIREARLGPGHVETAAAVSDLAYVLEGQGRYADAEPLDRRALALREARLGADDPDTLTSVNNLGGVLAHLGRTEEAEALYRRALAGGEKRFGANDTTTAMYLNNLGWLLDRVGKAGEAESLHRRALAIRESKLGPESADVASSLKNLAFALDHLGRNAEAEAARRRALAIREARLGAGHPLVAQTLAELAGALAAQGRAKEAEPSARRAVEIARAYRTRENAAADALGGARDSGDPVDASRGLYAGYLPIAWQADASNEATRDEAFQSAQDLDVSGAARALAQAAARVGAGACVEGIPAEDCLATQVRRLQDLAAQLRDRDRELLAATARGDGGASASVRKDIDGRARELAAVQARLRERFPDYAALVAPGALSIAQAQARLHVDEGLLLLVPAGKDVFAFGIGAKDARWQRVEGGAERVAERVVRLRCQADPATCGGGEGGTRGVVSVFGNNTAQGNKPFDRDVAHALYAELVAPVEPAFAKAKKLYVVASGPLGGLPLGVLVTQAPIAGEDDADPAVLARTAWLADRYALTTLPAVSSLRALSREARRAGKAQPFLGFGDPVLLGGGAPAASRGAAAPRWFRSAGDAQGLALADPATLRTQMAPLPGTRVELAAMAEALHAPADALHLGEQATEAAVKTSTELSQARVVAFATHGLLPQEVRGLDEPGLVFTPPEQASAQDDGVLSASEAATLDLDADWLILSACNTAAADGKSGGDSLSGLARAFLYAGARSMLVSHWRVRDDVTSVLTVETLRNRGKGSRAQSLQQAMHAVRTGKLSDGSTLPGWTPGWSHPSAWAPFVVVSDQDQ